MYSNYKIEEFVYLFECERYDSRDNSSTVESKNTYSTNPM